VSEAGKLFHGLERANACVRDLLHELRGPHYMEDRGERLYGILEEEGSGGRMIHYKYNATRDTWGQTYTVLVPNALATLGDGTQYRAADEKKQKLGTFLNRLGIFGHPFIRASLDIWRETHGK